MDRDNIPSKDIEFNDWQATFVSFVVPKKVEFGIPDAAITPITNAQAIWAAIWLIAKVKSQRTPQQVTEKDQARAIYESLLRPFIQQYIMVNNAISDGDREAMGIKPRSTEHTPIGVPTSVPVIIYEPLVANRLKFTYKQHTAEPGSSANGKPEGVAYCEFAYQVGGTPPAGGEACVMKKLVSRSPFIIQFTEAQAGQKVYAYARWVNPRGEGGPFLSINDLIVP